MEYCDGRKADQRSWSTRAIDQYNFGMQFRYSTSRATISMMPFRTVKRSFISHFLRGVCGGRSAGRSVRHTLFDAVNFQCHPQT
eukprot:scaffold2374_cov196-Chaetoceros_neogracile.AAC.1